MLPLLLVVPLLVDLLPRAVLAKTGTAADGLATNEWEALRRLQREEKRCARSGRSK